MRKLFCLILLTLAFSLNAERVGPHYYDPSKPEDESSPDKPDSSNLTSSQQVAVITKEYDEALSRSILKPTRENILYERMLHKLILDISTDYGKNVQYVVSQTPALNEYIKNPSDHHASRIHSGEQQFIKEAKIKNYAKRYALVAIYEGKKPQSQDFGKKLKSFVEKFDFSIQSISVDKQILEIYPNSSANINAAKNMGVNFAPCVLAFDMQDKNKKPLLIAVGNISVNGIIDNFILVHERYYQINQLEQS